MRLQTPPARIAVLVASMLQYSPAIKGAALLPRADCPPADPPLCQTRDASPLVTDCETQFGPEVDNLADACAQPYGSGCRGTGAPYGTCEQVYCQEDSSASTVVCLPYDQTHCLGIWTQQLIDQCQSNGKVGGHVHVPQGDNYMNVEPVHS